MRSQAEEVLTGLIVNSATMVAPPNKGQPMAVDAESLNYPAAAWRWLTGRLAELDAGSSPSILGEWRQLRQDWNGKPTSGSSLIDWPSDFWIAKTQGVTSSFLTAVWSIPEAIDHWPTLRLPSGSIATRWRSERTNSESFARLLAGGDATSAPAAGEAVRRFYDLNDATATHGDQAMISANQIRAWVATAFGDLLSGIAFTATDDPEVYAAAVAGVLDRVTLVDALPYEQQRNSWLDFGCDTLYNLAMTADGVRRSGLGVPRQGQGTQWQHNWTWLSTPQDVRDLEETVQLAGQLMINDAMLTGLALVVSGGGENARRRAVCVVRRWLMTAKVLSWIVESLRHPWTTVRPEDLATFGFSSLSPAWPRRTVALSHRSAEAKPVLTSLRLWNSPHVAVDANYVPAWETNTGMIWSLFAPVPLIARVASPTYRDSEWCSREYEMSQYLVQGTDFLAGRTILDLDVEELPELDQALFEIEAQPREAARIASLPAPDNEFPPGALVLLADVAVDLDVALLRAARALRLINAHVGDPRLANQFAQLAAEGVALDVRAPTNNPDGWDAYGQVFRDLAAAVQRELALDPAPDQQDPMGPTVLELLLPEDYPPGATDRDRNLATQIPDLREAGCSLADILAALEWQATLFDAFNEQGYGDKVVADVSGATAEEWVSDPRRSVARGLLALNNNFSPTWVLQRAGQTAHSWPGVREQPVFTRHVDHQFSWLQPVALHPTWLIYYHASSGLEIGPQLEAAMIGAIVRAGGRDALEVRHEGEDVGLVVPEPKDFFLVAADTFSDVLNFPKA